MTPELPSIIAVDQAPKQKIIQPDLIDLEQELESTYYLDPSEPLAYWDYPELDETPMDRSKETLLCDDWPESLYAPDYLTEPERQLLHETSREFLPTFTKVPGLCTLYRHHIDTGDHNPVSTTLRPMSIGKRKIFDETFNELVDYEVIEPCDSPWQ